MNDIVLLVDDDRAMLLALQRGLARFAPGMEVHLAGDGVEALERIRSQDVSLVVTDLKMPRMDGFELLAAVMRGYPDIPVLVISGVSTPDMERLALQGGAVALVTKPFLLEDLARRIQALLRRASEGGILHQVSPGMFLQLIEMEQKSCVIRVAGADGRGKGALFFLGGRLVDARVGARQGEAAAYEIFSWDPVSLSIQNECAIRERRIFKDLNALVIESARRQDEHRDTSPGVPAAAPHRKSDSEVADPLARVRARLAEAFGDAAGVGALHADESWDYRLKRLSQSGERLGFGNLLAGYLSKGEGSGVIVTPAQPARVLPISPRSPRERLLQFMANESGGPS
ncbi:MAG TPA: response regulator [Desulfobacterales bacterium]|nr:response regulator [Desulfobacterales bacterium]